MAQSIPAEFQLQYAPALCVSRFFFLKQKHTDRNMKIIKKNVFLTIKINIMKLSLLQQ